jgi:hypothetical protein
MAQVQVAFYAQSRPLRTYALPDDDKGAIRNPEALLNIHPKAGQAPVLKENVLSETFLLLYKLQVHSTCHQRQCARLSPTSYLGCIRLA